MKEFRVPELGENIESAEIVRVLVSEGDEIEEEQDVLELETEKATIELPCPYGGRIAKIHVGEGETISVGDLVLSVENGMGRNAEEESGKDGREEDRRDQEDQEDHEDHEDHKTREEKDDDRQRESDDKASRAEEDDHRGPDAQDKRSGTSAGTERKTAVQAPKDAPAGRGEADDRSETETSPRLVRDERGPAGPGTRRLARELGVDLSDVEGTGSGGRITRQDVTAYAQRGRSVQRPDLPDFERWGAVERLELSSTMRAVARNVSTSWQLIPHVTHHDEAEITELEGLRKRYIEENDPAARMTLTALSVKVVAIALGEHRRFNSSFDAGAGEIIVKDYVNIGIAVDTERGLVVPVIRDCDQKSVVQIAGEVNDLAERGRSGKLDPEEMQGGTFTITNLGGLGGLAFTPIIRYPEVAILGLSRAAWKPAESGDSGRSPTGGRRLVLPMSLSYDHRVINGADAARFTTRIVGLLRDPMRWLFEG